MVKVPTQNKYNAEKRQDNGVQSFERKTKTEVIEEAGFTPKQVQRFETLAAHPEIVDQAKAEARECTQVEPVKITGGVRLDV